MRFALAAAAVSGRGSAGAASERGAYGTTAAPCLHDGRDRRMSRNWPLRLRMRGKTAARWTARARPADRQAARWRRPRAHAPPRRPSCCRHCRRGSRAPQHPRDAVGASPPPRWPAAAVHKPHTPTTLHARWAFERALSSGHRKCRHDHRERRRGRHGAAPQRHTRTAAAVGALGCAGGTDLSTGQALRAAVIVHNHP